METGERHMKATIESKDIFFILAASFCFMASPMLVTPLITGFSGSIGASAALMGIIGGLTNLCSLLCRPLVGNLADRVSKYRMCFLGAGLAALACVGYIAAFHPGLVIAARVVNGVGYACSSVCVSTWLSNLLPKEKIGSGMGFYGMMNALAMAVAPAIGISVYHVLGYHAAFGAARAHCRRPGAAHCPHRYALCHPVLRHAILFDQLCAGAGDQCERQFVFSHVRCRAASSAAFSEKLV